MNEKEYRDFIDRKVANEMKGKSRMEQDQIIAENEKLLKERENNAKF